MSRILTPLHELMRAGFTLAAELERFIEGCGHRPPGKDNCDLGCECCGPGRNAINYWAFAVVRARRAELARPPSTTDESDS